MPDKKLDNMDKVTSLLERVIGVLLIRNPTKTTLGVMLGIVLFTISDNVIHLTRVAVTLPWHFWIALSVLLLNFRNLSFIWHTIDEELETQMYCMEVAQKKGHFSEREKRQQWRNFVSLVHKKASESMDNYNAGQSGKDKDRTATQ